MRKAVVTVVGQDKVGIIAAVSGALAGCNVNILDISQTVMQEYFTMMMLVDLANMTYTLSELSDRLDQLGREQHLKIRVHDEELFNAMHRV